MLDVRERLFVVDRTDPYGVDLPLPLPELSDDCPIYKCDTLWLYLPKQTWEDAITKGFKRMGQKVRPFTSYKNDPVKATIDGMLGEMGFGAQYRLPVNWQDWSNHGDGGTDFLGTYDVKVVADYWFKPILKLNTNTRNIAPVYPLAAVDWDRQRVRIVGFITGKKLVKLNDIRNFGKGPRWCYEF